MRPALFALLSLTAMPALAGDVEFGVDADVAFALGSTFSGPGGGALARVGYGPKPLALGPSALSVMVEVAGSFWRFPKASEPDVDLIRALVGGRFIYTIVWLRKPADDGGRGRGIRLDLPLAVHGGVGSLDHGTTWTPTGSGTLGLAVGFLPVQIGVHMGAGALAASPRVDGYDGSGWVNAGVDLGFVF
jgi:hypothetical protein